MSELKFSPELFLGSKELIRFQEFMNEKSVLLVQLQANSFGLIKGGDDLIGNNFLVEEGTASSTIKIDEKSYAIDSNGDFIVREPLDNIVIPNESIYYWVRISHEKHSLEEGVVNVDSSGNLTGTSTKFTEVLRGLPNFPSKIKFVGASLNVEEYEVNEVISNTSVVLNGDLSAESDLQYSVVGTFTPGKVVQESDKYPFQYDSCEIELLQEPAPDAAPDKISGEEFYIARVRRVGAVVTIVDKRTEFLKMRWET